MVSSTDTCRPANYCGRWYYQSRCTCGWRGPRRWIAKAYIALDYLMHKADWPEVAAEEERAFWERIDAMEDRGEI